MTITSYSLLMLPSQWQVARQALSAHRYLATSPHRHFERSKPTFSSPFASCEWVGLRREKSLFDQASSANRQTTAKQRRAIHGTVVDAHAVLANALYDFNVWSREKEREKLDYTHANPSKNKQVDHPRD
jgi:hypothetical protein